jgi:NADPH:quinone reductase-like Zn-dependent oxidoreductase
MIPCSDGAGEILEIGPDVSQFSVGDRVMTSFAPQWIDGEATHSELRSTLGGPLPGTLRELGLFSESALVKIPDYLSWEEAATLPCAGVTAWSSLVRLGEIRPGQVVLTQGTGGVSLFALQIAKIVEAKVVLTTGSEEKEAKAKALGADLTINYRTSPGWGNLAREYTGKRGVDHVIEVGGAGTL